MAHHQYIRQRSDLDHYFEHKKWKELSETEREEVARAIRLWFVPEIMEELNQLGITFSTSIGQINGTDWSNSHTILNISVQNQSEPIFSKIKHLPIHEIKIAPLLQYYHNRRGSFHGPGKTITLISLDPRVFRHELRHAITEKTKNIRALDSYNAFKISPNRIPQAPVNSPALESFIQSHDLKATLQKRKSQTQKIYGDYLPVDELYTYSKDLQSYGRGQLADVFHGPLQMRFLKSLLTADYVATQIIAAHDQAQSLFSNPNLASKNPNFASLNQISFRFPGAHRENFIVFNIITPEQKQIFERINKQKNTDQDIPDLIQSYVPVWNELYRRAKATVALNARVAEIILLVSKTPDDQSANLWIDLKKILQDYGKIHFVPGETLPPQLTDPVNPSRSTITH